MPATQKGSVSSFAYVNTSEIDHMTACSSTAQAEANRALSISKEEKPEEFHHEDLQQALTLISIAFADADEINKMKQKNSGN